MSKQIQDFRYPGIEIADDGSAAVVFMETAGSEAAGAYPITPSTQMGEGWAVAVAAGKKNVNGRNLIFFEPEGEHAAAGVTAGMAMVGLRSTNFSSGQGIAYMHESLYAAVGKRLTYVLNIACRAITKQSLNVHAGHDDYHSVDDTGFFQLFAKDVQSVADLNLITHRIAELSLNPGICAQDGFLTSHVIETFRLPEEDLVREYLGSPDDMIDSPTPSQKLVFGSQRRRIPELYDFDFPAQLGVVQNQESYAQGVAAQRPFYFDHIQELTDQAFSEYAALTGRDYGRIGTYRTDDADYIILSQGSVICTAEAVADYMRTQHQVKVGVVDMVMFRPFPTDRISEVLAGKKGVLVLERTDQPLAVDQPLLRETRAALAQAQENGRAAARARKREKPALPYAGVPAIDATDVPDFYSGCFGMGSRDLQPGDIVSAIQNMLDGGRKIRQFYLGINFINPNTQLPKQQIWQEQIQEHYPNIASRALATAGNINLLPEQSLSLRIHSVGGWGAITMGKNLAMTASELLGLKIKANPKYGSEKKGQPTTFYATLAQEHIRINCEVKHVAVVLSPDSKVFEHSNPLEGLKEGGTFVVQSDIFGEQLWNSFPREAQRTIREKKIRVFAVNGFEIALSEASDIELRFRMQGVAFLGAFFRASPLMSEHNLDEETLFEGLRNRLSKKFGHLGERVVADNLRIMQRGFEELVELDVTEYEDHGTVPSSARIPAIMMDSDAAQGIGQRSRFWDQVCSSYKTGQDIIADPFTALSAVPAATASIRDMTPVRFTVPEFVPEKCTGCSNCWTQCPDSAIPGVVNTVEEVLQAAMSTAASTAQPLMRFKSLLGPLAKACRMLIDAQPMTSFAAIVEQAYQEIADRAGWNAVRRAETDADYRQVYNALADFPLAKTTPFFESYERKEKGSGGLLSITINPESCKGCDLCVEVCPDGALLSIRQTDQTITTLRHNWEMWKHLPETQDRFIKISNLDKGIGVLPSLLLKQSNYMSMIGGDGACLGCGEKSVIHMVTSTVHAQMIPRVEQLTTELKQLLQQLEHSSRELISAQISTESVLEKDQVVTLDPEKRARLQSISDTKTCLEDLLWRYTEGPSGNGRAMMGMSNATGCTSVWASTYPYNPYPFPWVSHLFQDAPSVAIGIFEGQMRKMADGFANIRRARKLIDGSYEAEHDEALLANLSWKDFSDEEFALCPPLFAVGGDGAMMDIGFQNLSRLLASDKPIRVIVVDTQVYSNTGGQACTSGFTGQVSDMAAYGPDQRGKEETRKELSLLAMAHRGAFVMQSSQARPAHLLKNVLKGLQARRPAIFILNTPCPPEWGVSDFGAMQAAELSLESRAVPNLVFDPEAGVTFSECLSLDGNPDVDSDWTSKELHYRDEAGEQQTLTIPVTIADWAATEARFRKHFSAAKEGQALVPFHEYLRLCEEDRESKTPFIYTLTGEQRLGKRVASAEIVQLAEERLNFWAQLREMSGDLFSESLQDSMRDAMEQEMAQKLDEIRAEYDAKIELLKAQYPKQIAQRLVQNLLNMDGGFQDVDIEAIPAETSTLDAKALEAPARPGNGATPVNGTASGIVEDRAIPAQDTADELLDAPWIDQSLCTACDDCMNLNNKLFAYDDNKVAYIKDPKGGSFRHMVEAAEICPASCIHPGSPLNPKEKGLEELIQRATSFN